MTVNVITRTRERVPVEAGFLYSESRWDDGTLFVGSSASGSLSWMVSTRRFLGGTVDLRVRGAADEETPRLFAEEADIERRQRAC